MHQIGLKWSKIVIFPHFKKKNNSPSKNNEMTDRFLCSKYVIHDAHKIDTYD